MPCGFVEVRAKCQHSRARRAASDQRGGRGVATLRSSWRVPGPLPSPRPVPGGSNWLWRPALRHLGGHRPLMGQNEGTARGRRSLKATSDPATESRGGGVAGTHSGRWRRIRPFQLRPELSSAARSPEEHGGADTERHVRGEPGLRFRVGQPITPWRALTARTASVSTSPVISLAILPGRIPAVAAPGASWL